MCHVHKLYGNLFVCLFICGKMDIAKSTFANFLVYFIVIKNGTVVEILPYKLNVKKKEPRKRKQD